VINPDSRFSIGLNVDRDHITLVVLDFVGKVRARASREIHFAKPSTVRTFFQRSVGQLLASRAFRAAAWSGSAWPFPTISRGSPAGSTRRLCRWAQVRIDELIGDVSGFRFIENDAAAAAVGELHWIGSSLSEFFYFW